MKRLIDREWLRKRKNIIIRSFILFVIPIILVTAYKIIPSSFQGFRNIVNEMPGAIKNFLGLAVFDRRSDLAVFLLFTATAIGMINIIIHALEISDDLVREERTGIIEFLIGRLCSRKELYLGKIGFSVLSGLAGQMVWCLYLCIIAVLGSSVPGQKLDSAKLMGKFALLYMTAFILANALSAMLGVVKNRTAYSNHWESVGIAIIVFGFLANPLRDYHFIYMVGYVPLSLIFSAIALIIGLEQYTKRNL